MRSKHVVLAIWKWEGVIVLGGTIEQYKAYADQSLHVKPDIGDHSCGHAYVEYGLPWVLWVDDPKNIPAIAHEAMHVASGVLEGRGLKPTSDSEEAYTYTMEHILREALKKTGWTDVKLKSSQRAK